MTKTGTENFPRTVEKALRVLDALAEADRPLGVSEVGARLSINNSTAYRIMRALLEHGYVIQNPQTSKYDLGFKVLELSHALIRKLGVRGIARPLMEKLAQETSETVGLAILDGSKVVYLDQVDGGEIIRLEFQVGSRWPLHATAAGKACLAFMDPGSVDQIIKRRTLKAYTKHTKTDPKALIEELGMIREIGYAFNRGEFESKVRAVGAPIFNVDNRPIGSVVLATPKERLPEDLVPVLGLKVVSIGREISKRMGSYQGKGR
jgi:DNA-binding IclR family transcriptional regulator